VSRLEVVALEGMPEGAEGARLGALLVEAADAARLRVTNRDVVVISQKVVSKAEGRVVALSSVEPGERAARLAGQLGKDPRLVQLALQESSRVVRAERGVLIVETKSGLVCANAGIDASNVPGPDRVSLLPQDPDASARRIRAEIRETGGAAPAVVISDSFGRPWRLGQAEVAIGCAGLMPLDDWRGRPDRESRPLAATSVAVADEAAAAADLVRGKDDGIPAALVRGLDRFVTLRNGPGALALLRDRSEDLFR
jgi:coenzyme F420-0:L-glutamate ligase / coenzyme F420-1:gamma-L-glutamate ligase